MTSNIQVEALSRLIAERPGLAEALQAVGGAEEAVEILAKAGAENGVAVDKTALFAYFAEQSATGAKLSDADLDQVAGGAPGATQISLFSLGIGCAVVSIVATVVAKSDCRTVIEAIG